MSIKLSYKKAGVDIKKADKTIELIKPLAKSTTRKEVLSGIGGFSGLFNLPKNLKNPVIVASTDGVGTKLKLAFKSSKHSSIGIDLVAMCINDLICTGAEPLFFLDYFACGKLSPNLVKEVIKGIANGCRQANCTLLGGETAELPGFYKNNEYDLAGFAVGAIEKKNIIDGKKIKTGDILIGIESSGLHSNGYSLAQKVFFDIAEWDLHYKHKKLKQSIGKILLTPTFIYAKLIKKLLKKVQVKGIANITGGGLTDNIPRIFPEHSACKINLNAWKKPYIFKLIQEYGNISTNEMLKTFNNGIGMVIIINKNQATKTINEIQKIGYKAYNIGFIIKGSPIVYYHGQY